MSEMFKLVAKLTLDTSEFDRNTEESKEKASVFADVLKADLVGKGISAAWDGLKKLGGAVKDFATDAVMSYGEIEQLKGGIETLFGDSAQKVLSDADQAFRTAGMSAADYMDTSIQSAASLINSLGGDQEKAAELMNMSITDMADNVNKMGTSMEGVQNAYRGFSRGNFTMLDNLALGFAGTKEGMQSLLDKAEEISGYKYDISSYSDIVKAIHVVQDEMGITGTTSREAAETIQGSLGSMKSAWENLVAGIADPNANMGTLIENMVGTAETALGNILPAVERAFDGIGDVLGALIPVVTSKVPELMRAGGTLLQGLVDGIANAASQVDFKYAVVPLILGLTYKIKDAAGELTKAGIELIKGLGNGISNNSSYLTSIFGVIFDNLYSAVTENVPLLFEAGLSLIQSLGEGIGESLPTLLENVLPMIEQFSEFFREGAGQLVDVGIDFILNLVQGIMDSLPTLIEQVPQIITNFAGAINDNAPKLIVGGVQLIGMIINGIISAIPTLIANIPQIFQAILAVWSALNWINLGKNAITFVKNGIEQLQTQVPEAIKNIGNKAIEFFKGINWATAGKDAINFIKTAITGLSSLIPNALKAIGQAAVNAFKSINWVDLGMNVIRGIVNGISSGIGWIKDAAKSAAKSALDAAKNLLDINSPSRVFRDEVGKMIPAGLAIGIDDGAADAIESAKKLSEGLFKPFEGLEAPSIGTISESGDMGGIQGELAGYIGEAIRANNEALMDGLYTAMVMAMRDSDMSMQIDGREFGRLLRDTGVVMA